MIIQQKKVFDKFIDRLNLGNYEIKGNELLSLCPNPSHKDKSLGSFYLNITNGKMHCFQCGYKNHIFGLCLEKDIGYNESSWLWRNLKSDVELLELPKVIDPFVFDFYRNKGFSDYAQKRLNKDILEKYNIYKDDEDNPMFFSIEKNQINSYWVRENGKYYLIEPKSSKSNGDIYGLHLPVTDYNILTEGHFDAPAVYDKLGYRGLSCFGTELSKAQIAKLHKIPNLILMLDGDSSGRIARNKLVNKLINKPDLFIAGGYNKDPDELSGKEIEKVFKNIMPSYEYQMYCLSKGIKL